MYQILKPTIKINSIIAPYVFQNRRHISAATTVLPHPVSLNRYCTFHYSKLNSFSFLFQVILTSFFIPSDAISWSIRKFTQQRAETIKCIARDVWMRAHLFKLVNTNHTQGFSWSDLIRDKCRILYIKDATSTFLLFFFFSSSSSSSCLFPSQLLRNYWSYRQMVGLLGQVISPAARPPPIRDIPNTEETRADIHAQSGIRTHDPSVWVNEDISCLKPSSHCDRLKHECVKTFPI
jgi:hypothetical protein